MKDPKEQYDQLVLVPMKILERILETQEHIFGVVSNLPNIKPTIEGIIGNKFIPESEAQKMLGRKSTWFFNMRKNGKLKYKKLGSRNYYDLESIESLLEEKPEQ